MSILNVIERSTNLIDLAIPREADISQYRLYVARFINDAYDFAGASAKNGVTGAAAPLLLATVGTGAGWRSPGLVRARRGIVEESIKGMTRIKVDLAEWYNPITQPNCPGEDEVAYFRVQSFSDSANAWLYPGPIYVVPTFNWYTAPTGQMMLFGRAPGCNTGIAVGNRPSRVNNNAAPPAPPALQEPGAMHIVFPKTTFKTAIQNLDAANNIYYSFDQEGPTNEIQAGLEYETVNAAKHLYIEADTASNFLVNVVTHNETYTVV